LLACLLALILGAAGCRKLQQTGGPSPAVERGELIVEPVAMRDAIPLEYGKLTAVIPHATSEQWAGLWFEQDDGTVTVVWVNVVEGRIYDQVTRIPRR